MKEERTGEEAEWRGGKASVLGVLPRHVSGSRACGIEAEGKRRELLGQRVSPCCRPGESARSEGRPGGHRWLWKRKEAKTSIGVPGEGQ